MATVKASATRLRRQRTDSKATGRLRNSTTVSLLENTTLHSLIGQTLHTCRCMRKRRSRHWVRLLLRQALWRVLPQ